MTHTIVNQFLSVAVSEHGAELQSIIGSNGTEYLWQGDPTYWPDRALNLFPYVAQLTEGKYYLDGQLYRMDIHGFAPYLDFDLDAPYLCIKPWCSLPSTTGKIVNAGAIL